MKNFYVKIILILILFVSCKAKYTCECKEVKVSEMGYLNGNLYQFYDSLVVDVEDYKIKSKNREDANLSCKTHESQRIENPNEGKPEYTGGTYKYTNYCELLP